MRQKNAANEIQKLLLEVWDPIGIRFNPKAENEYSIYVNDIYRIVQYTRSKRALFEYLWEVETKQMGLKGNKKATENFANFLYKNIKIQEF